ncbi:unnamed protein product [Sphacelaria rigidula]
MATARSHDRSKSGGGGRSPSPFHHPVHSQPPYRNQSPHPPTSAVSAAVQHQPNQHPSAVASYVQLTQVPGKTQGGSPHSSNNDSPHSPRIPAKTIASILQGGVGGGVPVSRAAASVAGSWPTASSDRSTPDTEGPSPVSKTSHRPTPLTSTTVTSAANHVGGCGSGGGVGYGASAVASLGPPGTALHRNSVGDGAVQGTRRDGMGGRNHPVGGDKGNASHESDRYRGWGADAAATMPSPRRLTHTTHRTSSPFAAGGGDGTGSANNDTTRRGVVSGTSSSPPTTGHQKIGSSSPPQGSWNPAMVYAKTKQPRPGTGLSPPASGGQSAHPDTKMMARPSAADGIDGNGGVMGSRSQGHGHSRRPSPETGGLPLKVSPYGVPSIAASGMVLPSLGHVSAGTGVHARRSPQPPPAKDSRG